MGVESSSNSSIDKLTGHYSSLFKLPSYRKVVSILSIFCFLNGFLSLFLLFPTLDGLGMSLIFALLLLITTWICDNLTKRWFLKLDRIYDIRRIFSLSLFCWILWFVLIYLGIIIALFSDVIWWSRFSFLGYFSVTLFRFTVFNSTSQLSYKRLIVASFFQPFCCVLCFSCPLVSCGY